MNIPIKMQTADTERALTGKVALVTGSTASASALHGRWPRPVPMSS